MTSFIWSLIKKSSVLKNLALLTEFTIELFQIVSQVMHSALWLLVTLLALTLKETHGKPNGDEVAIHKSSEIVTRNQKSTDDAKKSGAHHSKHKSFKSRQFHDHKKTSHKHGQRKGKLPETRKGKIGKNQKHKGKKHHNRKHHKKTVRHKMHKHHTKKHAF